MNTKPTPGAINAALAILGQPFKAWYELPRERAAVLQPPESRELDSCVREVERMASLIDSHMPSLTDRIYALNAEFGVSLYFNGDRWQACQCKFEEGKQYCKETSLGPTPEIAILACLAAEWQEIQREGQP